MAWGADSGVGPVTDAARGPAERSRSRSLVDREDALATVEETLDAVVSEGGRTLLVTGEAGVGRTALLDAVRERAAERGFAVFTGACEPTVLEPFGAIARAFERAEEETGVPGYLRSARGPVPEEPEAFAAQRNAQFHDVADEIRAMATIDPVALIVDDLQWADEATLALFSHFAEHIREWIYPVLVVGAATPGEGTGDDAGGDGEAEVVAPPASDPLEAAGPQPAAGPGARTMLARVSEFDRTRVIELLPLDRSGTEALVADVVGADPPADVVDRVHSATGGRPLAVRPLVGQLVESGALDPDAGTVTDDEGAVPADERTAVARRIEALPPSVERVLQAGAAAGPTVSIDRLRAVLDREEAAVADAVDALVAAGLWTRDGDDVRFAGSLVRDVALEGTPAEQLAADHAALAGCCGDVEPWRRAHHLAAAGDRDGALDAYVAAAEQAEAVVAHEVAARAYRRARALATALGQDARARELALRCGRAHLLAGEDAAADEQFRAAREGEPNPARRARAFDGHAELQCHRNEHAAAVRLADEGLSAEGTLPAPVRRALLHTKGQAALQRGDLETARATFERELAAAGDDRARTIALTDRAMVERRAGDLEEARSLLEEAIELGDAVGAQGAVDTAVRKLAVVEGHLGEVEQAAEHHHRLIGSLQERGAVSDLPTAMMDLGVCYFDLGEVEKARDRFDTSVEMAEKAGREETHALAIGNLGIATLTTGDRQAAVEYCERSVELLGALDRRDRAAFRRVTLAFGYYLGGRDEDAMATVERALETARDTGQKYAIGYALRFRGRFRRAAGDVAGAVEDHEEAIDVLESLGNARHEADARAQLAEDHLAAGRPDAALAAAEAAFQQARSLDQVLLEAKVGARLGSVRRVRGDYRGAAAALGSARVAQHDRGDVLEETWTLLERARLERDRGDAAAARSNVGAARELAADADYVRFVRTADRLAESL